MLLALLLGGAAFAQKNKPAADPKKELLAKIEASYNVFKPAGLAVAVVKDGQVLLSQGWGTANADTKAAVHSNSVFNIASCSKAFTAAAIGLLVEEGKLRWEDKVIDYIPGFQLSDPWVTSELTIRDLLCHRSGLGTFDGDLLWYGTSYKDEDVVARMRHLPLRQGFRSEFGYQNNLYTVAGMVVQQVTGRTWSQFIQERFFKPLEMGGSFPSNDELDASTDIAYGHVDGKAIPVYDYSAGKPAASIYSSVDDLAHWVQMWLDGGKWKGRQVLDPRTIRALTTAQTLQAVSPLSESWGVHFRAYALGWGLFDYAGRKVIEHNGGMPGYISKVALVPELGLGIVILNNGNDGVVNDAVRYKLLDHFAQHAGQDWDKVFKGLNDMGNAAQAAETKAREDARVPGTSPSLALDRYAGTYHDPSYGDARVERRGEALHFTMVPTAALFNGKMEHFHYDTWKVQLQDPYLPFALVSFSIGPKGEVLGFKIDLPNGDFHFHMLDFKRQ